MSVSAVYSDGICHGLPVIPHNQSGLHAIVVGASGMSGQSTIDVLVQNPKRWQRVYALSRRPPIVDSKNQANCEHIRTDLLDSPETIGNSLMERGVRADVVFFFGYVQLSAEERKYSAASHDAAEKLSKTNGQILQTFLSALDHANIKPRRILLQTGLKNYGVHLGPVTVPCHESDPRVLLRDSENRISPNFYYTQEDILFEYCKSHDTTYNITMPSWILGAVKASDMTTFYPLAVYAAVQRKLGRKLEFPGDIAGWEKIMPMSSANLNSLFHEWVVLVDGAENERFNIVDGSEFTWMKAWPKIAEWFGMEWEPPKEEDEAEYKTVEMPLRPRGYGPKGRCRSTFSLAEWCKQSETREAWKALMQEHNLESDPFEGSDGMFPSLQFSLTMSWSWATSMDKARDSGWHGSVDTTANMKQVFEKFEEYKMIPPLSSK